MTGVGGRSGADVNVVEGSGYVSDDVFQELNNKEGKEMFYLTTHSTHFIYGYMASDIWLRTILIVRKETRCRHIGYSLRLTARVLLYAPSYRQDSTYHGLCYTSLSVDFSLFISVCLSLFLSRSSQCSTTGVSKAVVCAILPMGLCI